MCGGIQFQGFYNRLEHCDKFFNHDRLKILILFELYHYYICYTRMSVGPRDGCLLDQ